MGWVTQFIVVVVIAVALKLAQECCMDSTTYFLPDGHKSSLPPIPSVWASKDAKGQPVYQHKPLTGPVITGPLLNLFAFITEVTPLKQIVNNAIYHINEFRIIRSFSNTFIPHLPTTFVPLAAPEDKQVEEGVLYHKSSVDTFLHLDPAVDCTADGWDASAVTAHTTASGSGSGNRRYTVTDYACQYAKDANTPTQVARAVLAAIRESNKGDKPLNAFIEVYDDLVLEQAAKAEARWKKGKPLSILDGVPVGVKDELDVAQHHTRVGTTFLGAEKAKTDALIVARLRLLGAVIVGHTNMHAIGLGTTGINPSHFHGTTRNPYHLDHITGGSSSGSAAAVASGLVPVALSADGGGSIRLPAGLCGVVGMKATWGRIPEHGSVPLCPSVGHVGAITASVRDQAIAYMAIAGSYHDEVATTVQPKPNLHTVQRGAADPSPLHGLRVGVFWDWLNDATPEMVSAANKTVQYMEKEGAEVVPFSIPYLHVILKAHALTIASEMAGFMDPYIVQSEYRHMLNGDARALLSLSRTIMKPYEYMSAQRIRTFAMALLDEIFDKVDVFITPNTAVAAPRIPLGAVTHGLLDVELTGLLMKYQQTANFVGNPGITVPVGQSTYNQLPLSIQLQARHWNENKLLAVAQAIERQFPIRTPDAYYNILKKDNK